MRCRHLDRRASIRLPPRWSRFIVLPNRIQDCTSCRHSRVGVPVGRVCPGLPSSSSETDRPTSRDFAVPSRSRSPGSCFDRLTSCTAHHTSASGIRRSQKGWTRSKAIGTCSRRCGAGPAEVIARRRCAVGKLEEDSPLLLRVTRSVDFSPLLIALPRQLVGRQSNSRLRSSTPSNSRCSSTRGQSGRPNESGSY